MVREDDDFLYSVVVFAVFSKNLFLLMVAESQGITVIMQNDALKEQY